MQHEAGLGEAEVREVHAGDAVDDRVVGQYLDVVLRVTLAVALVAIKHVGDVLDRQCYLSATPTQAMQPRVSVRDDEQALARLTRLHPPDAARMHASCG